MKPTWTGWTAWWQAQPRRQQLMVLAAIVVLGAGAIDLLVWSPAEKSQKTLRNQIATLNEQGRQRTAQAALALAEQQRLRADEATLRERLAGADAAIARARAGLAGPEALRQRIRDLSQNGAVQLVSLTTLPAEPVSSSGKPPAAGEGAALTFRMPVTATVEGSYAALREHLVGLEAGEAGLAWHSLSLDNATWPKVRMELKLMLLSDRAQWRGP